MDRRTILQLKRNCGFVGEVERAGILIDARDYYLAFFEAARRAKRSILLAGWQFDSKVQLVRGADLPGEKVAPTTVELLRFIDELCEANDDLHVHILAWDFAVLYAFERELLQQITFDWTTNPRMRFHFDNCHPLEGCHHQKFVVIDGTLAFVGGIDLCEHRWDRRAHLAEAPERTLSDGTLYPPYHDLQAFLIGPAVEYLVDMFHGRWKAAGGEPIAPAERAEVPANVLDRIPYLLLPSRSVALSQTRARCPGNDEPVAEIRALMEDAIASAESLIYIEQQYLSSLAVSRALVARMRAEARAPLEIVIVLPEKPEALKEEVTIGLAQARMLQRVRTAATRHGHRLGMYWTSAGDRAPGEVPVYIHSKLMIVDDRFLTVGSANMTNRSLGLDSELNVSWEAEDARAPLARRIRRLRMSLLAEHAGPRSLRELRSLSVSRGLVDVLDRFAADGLHKLRPHVAASYVRNDALLGNLDDEVLAVLDPDEPKLEGEKLTATWKHLFEAGLASVWATLARTVESSKPEAV